ncbi:MAG: carbon dioxide-concentrating mechanism protein CcmK [Cyanobacteria bacterium P01_D01_bin.116]
MPMAVGVIETLSFPAILIASDTMVKSAAVSVVFYDKSESGRFFVAVRGRVAEVQRAVAAGIEAAEEQSHGGQVMSHYIVPNPPENVESVLPIHFTSKSEPFRL